MDKTIRLKQLLKLNSDNACQENFKAKTIANFADLVHTTLTGANLNVLTAWKMPFVREKRKLKSMKGIGEKVEILQRYINVERSLHV